VSVFVPVLDGVGVCVALKSRGLFVAVTDVVDIRVTVAEREGVCDLVIVREPVCDIV
jgi:hypothetical protein